MEPITTEINKWADDPFKEPATWTEARKKILLDDHRLVHAAYKNILSGKTLIHRKGSLKDKPITKEWVIKLHKWIVEHMFSVGFEHHMVDSLDETLPEKLKAKSIVKELSASIAELLGDDAQDLIQGLTTVSGDSLIPKEIAGQKKKKPRWAKYLTHPHGALIWRGVKTLIVNSVRLQKHIEEPLLLVSGDYAYCILSLNEPQEISKKEFESLFKEHRITEKEFENWGFEGKQLYSYTFDILHKYKEPIKIEKPRGLQRFTELANIRVQKAIALDFEKEEQDISGFMRLSGD